jgi:hypothetical protein
MDIRSIVSELKSERDRINQAIATLEGLTGNATQRNGAARRRATSVHHPPSVRKGRSRLTPEGRRRLSQLMKRRWAERRKKAE